jgi:hypothetical protein
MRQGKTKGRHLAVLARRRYVFELRLTGATYTLIRDSIHREPQFQNRLPRLYDERQVYRDVVAEMKRLRPTNDQIDAVRQMELDRLDALHLALWPRALDGDPTAIEQVLKLMARRARYMPGVEAPIQVAQTTPEGAPVPPHEAGWSADFCAQVIELLVTYGSTAAPKDDAAQE